MARFRYLGEPPKTSKAVKTYKITQMKVPQKDGSKRVLTPIPPATFFEVGQDLGYDITDERSLRVLRADTRYEEIV